MRSVRHPTTKEAISLFDCLEEMVVATAEAVRPPERITVSEAAERYHIVKNPGQHDGPFSLDKTPYLREPMDVLTSLDFTGMAFAGPARTGKSAMAINWLCHTAITDPTDMMIVHMAQHTARDWSQADLAKAVRNSPELKRRLTPGRQNDNVYDKRFLSGMRLLVTWPTLTNLSGKTIPRNFIMDMDRIKPQIIEKEGHVFDLTAKRGDTFKRYQMTAAESSPGFPVTDPKWTPPLDAPHEAPPCEGILSIYNRGDRRRWYWKCPHCSGKFQPQFKLLRWPDSKDIMEAAEQTYMACPHCFARDGAVIVPGMQDELNHGARWIKEGQVWLPDDRIVGVPRRSEIASFWMFGPAAGFTDWPTLVRRYLRAMEQYDKTGDEGPLMTTVTVDQGDAYVFKTSESGRLWEELADRARPYSRKGEVPPGVALLITTIDVQAGGKPCFVCHTFGLAPVERAGGGWAVDVYHVDMWKERKAQRLDEDGHPKLIDPASYPEDWNCLIDVIERSYPLADGSGRHMRVKLVACDSGGAAKSGQSRQVQNGPKISVTANAYEFWRSLKVDTEGRNLHLRFHLLKGAPSDTAPELHKTFPDSQQKDRFAIARGDVPVWLVNSNKVKDRAANLLGRTDPGGQIHFPLWYDEADGKPLDINWLYRQLTTEVRNAKGWDNPSGRKNEAFDLLAYCLAFCGHPDLRLEHVDWAGPPGWCDPDWDRNSLVFDPDVPEIDEGEAGLDISALAGRLA